MDREESGMQAIKHVSLDGKGPQTIFVVDDDPPCLMEYAAILEGSGYRVRAFADAESAVAAVRSGANVDAVVTDYRMPNMDGMAFLEILRCEAPAVPVIMLTGHGGIDTYFESLSLGLFEYINKPIKRAELLRIVRAALGESGGSRPVVT
jgi:DNA-binding NtrC family response regulator